MMLSPPTDEQVSAVLGHAVHGRAPVHAGHLSVVERLQVRDSPSPAILKTVCPALAHERHVHMAVQDYAVCAARLLACGSAGDGHDAWLLLEEIQEIPFNSLEADAASQALVALAAVHRDFAEAEVPAIPGRDPEWLASHADETTDRLRYLVRHHQIELCEEQVDVYPARLQRLVESSCSVSLSLIHGDFDPGNLVQTAPGSFAALDWGLGHFSTPLADFAHMAERYPAADRRTLAETYAEAIPVRARDADQILEEGLLAHRAFFVWWHSLIVSEGWAPPGGYLAAIAQRVETICHPSTDS